MKISELLIEYTDNDVFYHGGSITSIVDNGFDTSKTGFGDDELGTGFYFTNNKSEASGYAKGESGGVVAVKLNIKKPIVINGGQKNLRDINLRLTASKVYQIISRSPIIRNIETTPLWNWIDLSQHKVVTNQMLMKVASEVADGADLYNLHNDFFGNKYATEYREAIKAVLGYDGVVKKFGDGREHRVAWFPSQIKFWNE